MTCDHPKCNDDVHKTYSDEKDNELELCEAHYYYLVSGDKPPRTEPDPFAPAESPRAFDRATPPRARRLDPGEFDLDPRP